MSTSDHKSLVVVSLGISLRFQDKTRMSPQKKTLMEKFQTPPETMHLHSYGWRLWGRVPSLEEYMAFLPYNKIAELFTAALKVCHKLTMPFGYTLLQIEATLPVTVCTASPV